ncbi:MAG TPA: DMT family transporter [Thermoanaerobaculia bacterium]|nr:DMT family transporter [Thermoanaerobaculia bacterium]
MTGTVALILIAAVAGVAVALQGLFMGAMDRNAGTATSVFVTYGIGALIAASLWIARGAPLDGLRRIPWYSWTAGAFGLVIVGGIGYAAPRLGLGRTLVITIAAQLLAAMLLERPYDLRRIAGFLVVVAGAWLSLRD